MTHAESRARNIELNRRYKVGESLATLMSEFALCAGSIYQICRKMPGKRPYEVTKNDFRVAKSNISDSWVARNEAIVSAFQSGLTLQQVADQHNVTRQRIEQILKKRGVKSEAGGQQLKSRMERESAAKKRAAKFMLTHGMTREQWATIGRAARLAFKMQRNSANQRGIEWGLSLAQWWDVWQTSGKWELRGRGKGHYCMSRINDENGYRVGNVSILRVEENGRDYQSRGGSKIRKDHNVQGVYLIYPNLAKPYIAKLGKKYLGQFATIAEGVAARELAMAA